MSKKTQTGQKNSCIAEIDVCLKQQALPETLPETIIAGIVPHAGWSFSGATAAMVFAAIKKQNDTVHTFCIFGASHGYFGQSPAVYDKGAWLTPLG